MYQVVRKWWSIRLVNTQTTKQVVNKLKLGMIPDWQGRYTYSGHLQLLSIICGKSELAKYVYMQVKWVMVPNDHHYLEA